MVHAQLEDWAAALIQTEIQAWPLYGAKADIQSAVDDYTVVLRRNRELEEGISRLKGDNDKLRHEKGDLMREITKITCTAHDDIQRAKVPLQQRISDLESTASKLQAEVGILQTACAEARTERDTLQQQATHLQAQVTHLKAAEADLETERDDLLECLRGEKDARLAATSELEARLAAKEKAEVDKERAEARCLDVETQYLAKVGALTRARDDANAEFKQYKAMQAELSAERAAWEDQMEKDRPLFVRRPRPGPINVGSFFGSVYNALRQPGQAHESQASAIGPIDVNQEEPIELLPALYPDAAHRHHVKAHGGGCNGVAFSPGGNYAASCGQDGIVRVWTSQDGHLSTELGAAHGRVAPGVNDACFTEDSRGVLAASSDKSIKLWDVHTGRARFTMTGHTAPVTAIAQHPLLHNIAVSTGDDRLIKIWSLTDGICQRTIACRSKPMQVTFTRDGSLIVSAHYDGSLHVFEPSTGSQVQHVARAHTRECVAVAPAMMPARVVSVGRDSMVCVTNVITGVTEHRYEHANDLHVGTAKCLPAVAPDDSVIAVGSSSGTLLLLNMADGQIHSRLLCHTSAITGVAWNTRGEDCRIVTASVDKAGDVVFWRSAAPAEE